MAQRVATEYVAARLTLAESDLPKLISLCRLQELRPQIFVLDNGNQEIVLEDESRGESIRLAFERAEGKYVCEPVCRIEHPRLTDALRKIVSAFGGDAVVNRIYTGFTMIYHYKQGRVARIVESKGAQLRIVFEHRDTAGKLEAVYRSSSVEREINRLKGSVNELLDLRNRTEDEGTKSEIDRDLEAHSRKLFTLEA